MGKRQYFILFKYWAFPEKNYNPLLRISIFLKLIPWISSQFYHDPPGIFHFFCIYPFGNPRFSLKFWHTLLEFQLFSLQPPPLPEISIDILNRGFKFFSGKAHPITYIYVTLYILVDDEDLPNIAYLQV